MADEALKQQIDSYVDEEWESIVNDIDSMVHIESVEDIPHAEPGKPFGPKSYEALQQGLTIAEKLGLEPHNGEGYIGFADLPGESERQIATIAHTDIVPTGIGWHTDPLKVTRRDGYLLGRGTLDDKGPFVLSLYAAHFFVKQVQKTGKKLPYTLRCLVGCNEETHMRDVEWYLDHYPQPDFLFTPDADFPLICGEKGRMLVEFTTPAIADTIKDFHAGTVVNAIPGLAHMTIVADATKLSKQDNIEMEPQDDGTVKLAAHGKGGHASMPWDAQNAIGILVNYMVDNSLVEGAEKQFFEFERHIFADWEGTELGITSENETFGKLSASGGTIAEQDGAFTQTADIRYPNSTDMDTISAALTKTAAPFGVAYRCVEDMAPFYTDPRTPEIQTLLGAYNEYTGRHDEAFTIGGGTYARHFKNACAFGPHDSRVEDPSWVGIEHGPDEGIEEDQLKLALKVYILSIARLMQLDL